MQGRKNSLASKLQRNFVRSSLHARRGGYKKEEEEEGPAVGTEQKTLSFSLRLLLPPIHTHTGARQPHTQNCSSPPLAGLHSFASKEGGDG